MPFMKQGQPWLYDDATGDMIGIKDPDGGERYFDAQSYTADTLPDPATLGAGTAVVVDGKPGIALDAGLATQRADVAVPIKTACGTYSGTGSALSVSLGFKPDVVLVKADAAQECYWKNLSAWYGRTDSFGALDSVGNGITFTDDGFTVGTYANLNTNATTYHYIAISGIDAGALASAGWQGKATERSGSLNPMSERSHAWR